jgi:signal transduction histidine kinase
MEQTHKLVGSIRDTIQGLRPAMLNYGLYPALEGLVDELLERMGDKVAVNMAVPASSVRYDVKAEQHLYRIVQQACENAVRHARCREVCISGQSREDGVDLEVQDDGVGFPDGHAMDLNELLMAGHFGLAGMFERAALIGAELRIEPGEGGGTRVMLRWVTQGRSEPV